MDKVIRKDTIMLDMILENNSNEGLSGSRWKHGRGEHRGYSLIFDMQN
jgi:hypothetical protein